MTTRVGDGLQVRHDHGSAYMSDDIQRELKFFGIELASVHPRAREPEGNGATAAPSGSSVSRRRTCSGSRRFETIEELRQALLEFQQTYNDCWILESHGYRTPRQVAEQAAQTLAPAA